MLEGPSPCRPSISSQRFGEMTEKSWEAEVKVRTKGASAPLGTLVPDVGKTLAHGADGRDLIGVAANLDDCSSHRSSLKNIACSHQHVANFVQLQAAN